jgi:hypothetical protein
LYVNGFDRATDQTHRPLFLSRFQFAGSTQTNDECAAMDSARQNVFDIDALRQPPETQANNDRENDDSTHALQNIAVAFAERVHRQFESCLSQAPSSQ